MDLSRSLVSIDPKATIWEEPSLVRVIEKANHTTHILSLGENSSDTPQWQSWT